MRVTHRFRVVIIHIYIFLGDIAQQYLNFRSVHTIAVVHSRLRPYALRNE
jgi:hypothetical protein